MTPALTIGVTTRNRPDALAHCLASLAVLDALSPEVILFDDGSEPPADVSASPFPVRVLRDAASPGYIVGRNRIVREASAPFVLLLDDDTRMISAASVRRAMDVLESDGAVG